MGGRILSSYGKSRLIIPALVALLAATIVFHFRTTARLRQELDALGKEYFRVHEKLTAEQQSPSSSQAGSNAGEQPGASEQTKFQELQSEVLRLRDAASRALRAEAEVAQLKSALQSRQPSGGAASSEPNSDFSSNTVVAYLGQPPSPPANIDPAYSKEGLLNAVQQAAQLASIPLKKVEIDTSEYPFLVGAVYDNAADFEKVMAQLRKMPGYQLTGSTGGNEALVFNITPYGNLPREELNRARTRTMVRTQMFFDRLNGR
jgi:hypothetical protein